MSLRGSGAHGAAPAPADSTLSYLSRSPTLQRDVFLLSWIAAAEERSARQAVYLQALEEWQEMTGKLYRHCMASLASMHSPPPLHASSPLSLPQTYATISRGERLAAAVRGNASAQPNRTFSSPLERLAAVADDACHDGDAVLDSELLAEHVLPDNSATILLTKRMDDAESTLAKLTRLPYPFAQPNRPSKALVIRGESADDALSSFFSLSPHVSLDACVDLLNDLVTSRSLLSELARRPLRRHPYEAHSEEPLLSATCRQRHVLSVLTLLRDALRSVQDAYACATHSTATSSTSPVSLDTLLQLPPDTLPLLMRTRNGSPAWCTLLTTTSLFTLWAALKDSVVLFTRMSCPVADALWAAALWMYTCAPPTASHAGQLGHSPLHDATPPKEGSVKAADAPSTPAQHRPVSSLSSRTRRMSRPPRASPSPPSPPTVSRAARRPSPQRVKPLNDEDDAFEERWAYRDFPVRAAYTAPTVYDALFPLPAAVSAFTKPEENSLWESGVEEETWLRGPAVSFFTGPSRRPQPL
ncbi:hypothetical protein ABL78_8363 [Leptomonas seymouri]|uniref:Uncharacterized protein n=1 Tax=Leptomonas seymouri TaxID=5684 RepID=A0A0N0P2K4_LEPSE|nr:hypothetical protein ABL78_8363 [Leptomonas seymouri]|eukprot:KPI82627.1 hypothetical protein ABL78_8363 [Leptomonas seymouri]